MRKLTLLLSLLLFSAYGFSLAGGGGNNGINPIPSDTLYEVTWDGYQNVDYTIQTTTLSKSNIDSWQNSGAYSTNILEANKDGYIIYEANSLQDEKVIGLSSRITIENHKNADYGFLMESNQLSIIESGMVVQNVNGNLQNNTELKIARESNKIKYYKDGLLLREINTNPNYKLRVETGIKNIGGEIKNPKTTFKSKIRVEITDIFHANCLTKELGEAIIRAYGTIYYATATVKNMETGQQWTLSPSGESDNYVQFTASLLYPGNYSVLVEAADGSTGTQKFTIRSIVNWKEQEKNQQEV